LSQSQASKILVLMGRGVLFLLVAIHFVLPFTPVNQHPELQIKIGSLILGSIFLWLGARSLSQPLVCFVAAFVLLIAVYIVSSVTGASRDFFHAR
jgi:hypothetical protein